MHTSQTAKYPATFALPDNRLLSIYCKRANNPSQLADIAALRGVIGAGVGAGGLMALLRTIKEVPTLMGQKPPQASMTGIPGSVEVPVPLSPQDEQQLPGLPKIAANDMYQGMAEMAYNNVLKPMGLDRADTWQTTTPTAKWWQAPATVGALAAGGAGGWKLVDWMADKRREATGTTDLTSARQEYEDAVKGLHPKVAALAEAREVMQKQALEPGVDALLRKPFAPNAMKNYAGLSTNAMAGIATALGIPTAMYAYNHTKETSDVKALQEALMARRRAQQMRNPAPPHMVLTPAV